MSEQLPAHASGVHDNVISFPAKRKIASVEPTLRGVCPQCGSDWAVREGGCCSGWCWDGQVFIW